jgi:hypothetical protein
MKRYATSITARVLASAALALALASVLPQGGDLAPLLLIAIAPFPVTPLLTAITVAYRNARLIADEVLPRVSVALQEFKYLKYPIGTFFTLPETKVGRKGRPNQVEFEATETPDSTTDHALDDGVPQADIDNAKQPGMPDPLGRAAEGLTELIMLSREKRTADLVFDAAQYAATHKVTLAGTDQWSDPASSPIDDILVGLDAMVMRATVMVIGRAAFTKLATHADIVKAMHGTSGDTGLATRRFIAELFELEEVLVGEGWVNTAKPGQPATLVRVWGKHAALLHRNKMADARTGTTFGFTAQWGGRVAGAEADKNIGMRGGQLVRVGESVKELITANDLGYLITNAVA